MVDLPLNVGDIVTLKCGSPKMVVVLIEDTANRNAEGYAIKVAYWDNTRIAASEWIDNRSFSKSAG